MRGCLAKVLETARESCMALTLLACSSGDLYSAAQQSSGSLEVPTIANFKRVGDAMQLHCGTLDCHGQQGRNMRLYGHFGLRLDPLDNPLEASTSTAEYEASYWSIVGLEPEIMASVVSHRVAPDQLSMVRKARGVEKHKGGQLTAEGDPLDRCIVGWLVGAFDTDACLTVNNMSRPEIDGGP
jgi:hypothetical protein